ncbi:MAG TPA: hypothetical protein VMW69_14960 [Spirochaetia bacterium]|nr:hypothetical protein [Spirochaetia bacterium]
MSYKPFLFADSSPEGVNSPEYREFVDRTVLSSGLRLLLERRKRRPDFPYPDTKFNPNTGEDYPSSSYELLFTWFLGRGSEACTSHLSVIDSIRGIADVREESKAMLEEYRRNQNEALIEILQANGGRIPFRVNRVFEGVDASGKRVSLSAEGCNASELFAAKALIAGGDSGEREIGIKLFRRFLDSALSNGYEDDTASYGRHLHAESPFMLSFALFRYLVGTEPSVSDLTEWARLAETLLHYVLDNFWEEDSRRFFELIDFGTKKKDPFYLPGHACELVGLGLQAVSVIEGAAAGLSAADQPDNKSFELGTFTAAKRELLRILLTAYDTGYDHKHGGMLQAINPLNGDVLNNDLPWWCLPEAMRAALYAYEAAEEAELRTRFLVIFTTASNDYFSYYPNPAAGLFPFRTRSGDTGEVRNFMPVVPEADPLYHSNISFIDMLSVLGRFR